MKSMKKVKASLGKLTVESFITKIESFEKQTVNGGTLIDIISLIICPAGVPFGPQPIGSHSLDDICPKTQRGCPVGPPVSQTCPNGSQAFNSCGNWCQPTATTCTING